MLLVNEKMEKRKRRIHGLNREGHCRIMSNCIVGSLHLVYHVSLIPAKLPGYTVLVTEKNLQPRKSGELDSYLLDEYISVEQRLSDLTEDDRDVPGSRPS